jgi:cytochrome c peroxidase
MISQARQHRSRLATLLGMLAASAGVCLAAPAPTLGDEPDPPEVAIGERLFLETRFAQFFHANCDGDVNRRLADGDRVMEQTVTPGRPAPGAFAGKSMNCRACHLVDEFKETGLGNRTYADFARRSPVPARDDGRTVTPRNSPALVNAMVGGPQRTFLHFDAEFASAEDLVQGTLTGEQALAVRHLAQVIREDDGSGELAREFGGAYRVVLAGTDPAIPPELRLPRRYRLDVARATDARILVAIARLVGAYLESLEFARDDEGRYTGSPYDVFLAKNHLPRLPHRGESDRDYSRRLLAAVQSLAEPQFVSDADRQFQLHRQPFQFGPEELAGLKLFFTERAQAGRSAGNCIACHAAPHFTDFRFHNTGAAQEEYDALHGRGAFAQLEVPGQKERLEQAGRFLPPSPVHPRAPGRFMDVPSVDRPGYTDLGLWNVFGNPALPGPQARLLALLRGETGNARADVETLLPLTIARFKTPGLRDLGHSAPYLHTGRFDSLEKVILFYREAASAARDGVLRNPAPELRDIRLDPADVPSLAAFLRALNEDYE